MPTERSNAEVASVIRMLWTALQAPDWARGELIDLGKHVFAKTPIEAADPESLNPMLPKLKVVALHLLDALHVPPYPTDCLAAERLDRPAGEPEGRSSRPEGT